MEKDYIAARLLSTDFEESHKSKTTVLDGENQKSHKTREQRLQSKAIFDSLMLNIEKEQKDR